MKSVLFAVVFCLASSQISFGGVFHKKNCDCTVSVVETSCCKDSCSKGCDSCKDSCSKGCDSCCKEGRKLRIRNLVKKDCKCAKSTCNSCNSCK